MFKKILLFIVGSFGVAEGICQQNTLAYFLEKAAQNSPLLKDYANQVQSNYIDSSRIRATYKPQVNASSVNAYAPLIHGYGYDEALSNIGNFNELLTVSKQLVSKSNLDNQFNAIRLANASLEVLQKISVKDLQKTVTAQYITAYGSYQQYLYNNEVYRLLSGEDTLLKALARANVYRQTDYLAFLVTLRQQELLVKQAQTQFENDYAQLNYLSGLFDTSFRPLTEPELTIDKPIGIEESVYYQKFSLDSLLLKNEDARIDFSYKPKVNVYADAGFVSSLQYLPYKNFGTSFGITLSVPIYDGKQKKMQHDKINLAEQTRKNYRDFFKSQYSQQVAQLMQQLESAVEIIALAKEQLTYSRGLIEANGKLLVTGDVHIADYILAINNYLATRNIITVNSINRLQIINQLNYWNKQ
jgi:outer membrane protein TolC